MMNHFVYFSFYLNLRRYNVGADPAISELLRITKVSQSPSPTLDVTCFPTTLVFLDFMLMCIILESRPRLRVNPTGG